MATVAQAQRSVRTRGRTRSSTRVGRRSIGRGWLIATYVALVIFILWTIIPFMWMILASFKTNKEIYNDFTFLPKEMYLGHYVSLMGGKFGIWLRNSAEVSIAATALSITLGAIGAYAITRLRFAGRRVIALGLVCTYLVPQALLFIPLFTPAIVVVCLFSFTQAWNEFLYALVITNSLASRTVTVGLTQMLGEDVFYWGQMMAGALITALPPVIMYTLAQRFVTKGLVVGGVKG